MVIFFDWSNSFDPLFVGYPVTPFCHIILTSCQWFQVSKPSLAPICNPSGVHFLRYIKFDLTIFVDGHRVNIPAKLFSNWQLIDTRVCVFKVSNRCIADFIGLPYFPDFHRDSSHMNLYHMTFSANRNLFHYHETEQPCAPCQHQNTKRNSML